MPDPLTQRRFPRYQIQLPVLHKTRPPVPVRVGVGWTLNLSEGGTCIELSEALEPLTPLRVILQTHQGPIEADVQVVWKMEAGEAEKGVLHGVAFTQIASEHLQALRNLIVSEGELSDAGVRLPLRLPVMCQIKGQSGVSLQGWTGDMSRKGLSVFLPQALAPGTLLHMDIRTPSGSFAAEGEIVWVGERHQESSARSLWHGVRLTAVGWSTPVSLGLYLAEQT